ncbi:MAG: YqaJ viral recombinase family protein [Lachnospiraceae bacterium]|nr:YqaJ viral recombinase family protein [Lachnospiraceae bacterium]
MGTRILVNTEGMSNEEWLKWRKKGLGGSDIAAILGISKWSSAIDIWLQKTNQKFDETIENEAMTWGKILEPVIREQFKQRTGKKVVEVHSILQNEEYRFMLADLDGLTEDENGAPAILEIKCVSEYKRSEWDNDQIPYYYMTQVMHYLAVTGLDTAYVVALVGCNSMIIREVKADQEMIAMLVACEKNFWDKVVNCVRPEADASDACKELLDSLYRGGVSEQIVLPEEAIEFVDLYLEASADEDSAKAKKQLASNRLKEIMGDYNSATCLGHTVSWKPVSTDRFDSKKFKEDEPELYAKYTKTSVSRRFSLK